MVSGSLFGASPPTAALFQALGRSGREWRRSASRVSVPLLDSLPAELRRREGFRDGWESCVVVASLAGEVAG